MALATKNVLVGKRLELGLRDLHQFGMAIAERRAPKPRHALQQFAAAIVVDVDARRPLQHRRAHLAMGRQVGIGVDEGLDIANIGVGKAVVVVHWRSPETGWDGACGRAATVASVGLPCCSHSDPIVWRR